MALIFLESNSYGFRGDVFTLPLVCMFVRMLEPNHWFDFNAICYVRNNSLYLQTPFQICNGVDLNL